MLPIKLGGVDTRIRATVAGHSEECRRRVGTYSRIRTYTFLVLCATLIYILRSILSRPKSCGRLFRKQVRRLVRVVMFTAAHSYTRMLFRLVTLA